MAGYTRQSLAAIQDGEDIIAAPLNAEFNQLQDAFNAVTGHTHDGTIGNGPKININNATTGTILDSRLPTSMAGKTFTSQVNISASTPILQFTDTDTGVDTLLSANSAAGSFFIQVDNNSEGSAPVFRVDVKGVQGIITASATNVTLTQSLTAATATFSGTATTNGDMIVDRLTATNPLVGLRVSGVNRGFMFVDQANDRLTFRKHTPAGATEYDLSIWGGEGTTALKFRGNTVWTAENDGTGSGLDAGLLEAQNGAFYRNATNINAGTLADARLPTSMAGKTFTTGITVSSGGFSTVYNSTLINYGDNGLNIVKTTTGVSDTGVTISSSNTSTSANGAWMQLYGSAHATNAGNMIITSGTGGDVNIRNAGSNKIIVGSSDTQILHPLTFGDGDFTDGETFLTFNGDRPWTIRQRGVDGTAMLSFENLTTKQVQFSSDSPYAGPVVIINPIAADPYISIGGFRVWHAGNDGAGSGLDADTIDGINGASLVQTSRTVTAGNGLTGGGALSANITLNMGTPSSITNSTTNSVGADDHTHALGFTAAEVYTGSGANDTNLSLGHMIIVFKTATGPIRNATIAPCLSAVDSIYYRTVGDASAGTALSGTWRAGGDINAGSDFFTLARRVA